MKSEQENNFLNLLQEAPNNEPYAPVYDYIYQQYFARAKPLVVGLLMKSKLRDQSHDHRIIEDDEL